MEFILHNYNTLEFSQPMRNNNKLKGMFPNSWRHLGCKDSHIFFKGGEFTTQSMMKISTVNWMFNEITIWPMGNLDALSFEFSGCVMAAFQWRGSWYSAHIQMGGEFPRWREWGRFISDIRTQITNLIMFRPDSTEQDNIARKYGIRDKEDVRIVGLITTEKECFTLFLTPLDKTEKRFKLLAYKQHWASCNIDAYNREILPHQSVLRAGSSAVWHSFFNAMGKSVIQGCEQFNRM